MTGLLGLLPDLSARFTWMTVSSDDGDVAPDDDAESRRGWRRDHRPPIRRSGHVLDLAMWLLAFAALFFVASGSGLARRSTSSVSAEESASTLLWASVALCVALLLVIARRVFVAQPDSAPRWAFITVAIAVPLTLGFHLLRYGDESRLAPATLVWSAASFALCVAMCVIPRRHRPNAEPLGRG
jgi:hypothetical protein